MCLLEDIFEAEDALPPDVDLADLPTEFFSHLTVESSSPLLSLSVIRKLKSNISNIARPTKRMRQNTRDGTHSKPPSRARSLADVETAQLARILRILDRTVKAGEDLDPFGTAHSLGVSVPKSPSKKAKGKNAKAEERRSKSKTPRPDGEADAAEEAAADDATEADTQALCRNLELAKDSVYAADCCLTLLGSERLTKQVCQTELTCAYPANPPKAVFRRNHHRLSVYDQEPAYTDCIPFHRSFVRTRTAMYPSSPTCPPLTSYGMQSGTTASCGDIPRSLQRHTPHHAAYIS